MLILSTIKEFLREYAQIIVNEIDILLYNKLYNKLVDLNIILLFKSIKLFVFTKRVISILKDIKSIEFEKIVNLIVRKLQRAIDDFVLSKIYERRIIAHTTNVEYYFSRSFKLSFFDNKDIKRKSTNISTNASFVIFTTSSKKRVFVSKTKLFNFLITSKNKLISK